MMHNDSKKTEDVVERVLASREEIQKAVARIGAEITRDYPCIAKCALPISLLHLESS